MLHIDIFLPFFHSYSMSPYCFRPRLLRANLRSNEKREKLKKPHTGYMMPCFPHVSRLVKQQFTTTTEK